MDNYQTIEQDEFVEIKSDRMKKQHKIVIIEDAEHHNEIFRILNDIPGYETTCFSDFDTSIVNIEVIKPDFVIVDIELRSKDQFNVWIRKVKKTRAVIFIIKDIHTSSQLCKELFQAGIDDFLNRPVCQIELNQRIIVHTRLNSKRAIIGNLKKGIEDLKEENSSKLLKMFDELQVAYKEMELRKKELESVDKAKSDFIKIVSHEIRTPLSGIIGFSQLLESKLPKEFNNYLNSLNQSALRLQDFSNKAILISKLKTNSYKINHENVSALHVIHNILEKYESIIKHKKLNVRNNITHRLIETDFLLFEKALNQVIDNAIRYAPEKSDVLIEELYANKKFTVMVIDQGPGFSEEVFNNIFGLFVHGDKYIDKNVGLGLYMAKLIMNYLDGGVKVANNKDRGALVKVILPLQ